MQALQAPAMLDEIGCQPIEQLGMGWAFAHRAKIGRSADQPTAKMMQPNAIYQYPRDERVEADPIGDLGRPLHLPDREVEPLAGLERAGLAGKAERARKGASPNPFIDPQSYRRYLEATEKTFREQLLKETPAK